MTEPKLMIAYKATYNKSSYGDGPDTIAGVSPERGMMALVALVAWFCTSERSSASARGVRHAALATLKAIGEEARWKAL